jgi:dGTPase
LINDDIKEYYPKICKNLFQLSSCSDVNRIILDSLIKDIINNSYANETGLISFSDEVSQCVYELKEFNKKYIYENRLLHNQDKKIRKMFEFMFEHFLKDYEQNDTKSLIFKDMDEPGWISKDYKKSVKPAEHVRDYLAGMTDRYFNNVFHRLVIPEVVTDFSKVPEWSKNGG